MNNLVKIGASSFGVVGLGGSLFSGMYFSSNDTVENVLKSFVLKGDSNAEDWEILQKKLEESWDKETSPYKHYLQEVKEKRKEIKAWCEEKYSKTINTLITGEEISGIRDLTKKYCTLDIKEKIGKEQLFDGNLNQGEEFNKQQKQLLGLAGKLQIETKKITGLELPSIDGEENGNRWKVLRDWCLNQYNSPYRGEVDKEIWKEVSENCRKDPNFQTEETET